MKPKNFSKTAGRTSLVATLVFACAASQSVWAANITMSGDNAFGASGFNSGSGWPSAVAPIAGNNYFTGTRLLRTPADAISRTCAGDWLTVDAVGHFLFKNTGTTAVNTVSNLILNGGNVSLAVENGDSISATLAGTITVNANSTLSALGGTTNNSGAFVTLIITAPISGSAGLTIAGSFNSGTNTGVVRLSADNPYSGTITVATPGSGIVASAVNRLLQLNNLNAVKNATLNLTSVANGISFTSATNTVAFNIGALTGSSNQVLADTASAPVTLNIGGSNANSTYAGILSGAGALVKSGGGTLTLSGAGTYAGSTTVSRPCD